MNAKFKWFGFSVTRKHVYVYAMLLATSLFANTIKDSFASPDVEAAYDVTALQEHLVEAPSEVAAP